ncbi:hypothetical protein ACRAWF_34845 [Streptomyces sp. L7]
MIDSTLADVVGDDVVRELNVRAAAAEMELDGACTGRSPQVSVGATDLKGLTDRGRHPT